MTPHNHEGKPSEVFVMDMELRVTVPPSATAAEAARFAARLLADCRAIGVELVAAVTLDDSRPCVVLMPTYLCQPTAVRLLATLQDRAAEFWPSTGNAGQPGGDQ